MKACPHCSATLEDDAVRCGNCGKWVIPGRGRTRSRQGRTRDRTRLLLLVGLILLAWVIWALPEGVLSPGGVMGPGGEVGPGGGPSPASSPSSALATLRSDLERLRESEEAYFEAHGEYSGNPGDLGFTSSDEVTVSIIATPEGWSGAATSEALGPERGCAVFVGGIHPPQTPVTPSEPGEIVCTRGT